MPAVLLGRCNPYGAESGGPARVLGGMYGPNSAATPGRDLPLNVAQGEWACTRPAEVRCRMVCRCGHKGQVMELCSWHDETVAGGEMVAGTFRQTTRVVRVHGHYEEIQRRQSDTCPRCVLPTTRDGDYAALYKEFEAQAQQLADYQARGLWNTPAAAALRQEQEDIGKEFDRARAAGIIHNCKLTLEQVS